MSRLVSVARIMAFAALLALPSAARAAIVDYDVEGLGQSVVDMGVVTAGYEGLVNTVDAVHAVPNDDGYSPNVYYNHASGFLAPNTKLTFTYLLSGAIPEEFKSYIGTSAMPLNAEVISDWGSDNPMVSLWYANAGTTNVPFSLALAIFTGTGTDFMPPGVMTYYQAEAISTVPLPAALPMFALGLAGLAIAKRRKKTA